MRISTVLISASSVLLLLGFSSASSAKPANAKRYPGPGQIHKVKKAYDGTISTFPIAMTLSRDGKKLSGSYAYKKVGKPIKLAGRVDLHSIYLYPPTNNATLEEFDGSGKKTAVFKGIFTDYEFVGQWHSFAKQGKKLPFKLIGTHSLGPGSVKIARKADTRYKSGHHRGVVYRPMLSLLPENVLSKTRKAIKFETVADGDDWSGWLDKATYYVTLNDNYILSLLWWVEGSGAYPDSWNKAVSVNLKPGETIKAKDLFRQQNLGQLASKVNTVLQKKIAEKIQKDVEPEDRQSIKERLSQAKFGVDNLDSFSISGYGITFLYNFDLPHAMKAVEPEGACFLSFGELKSFLRADGPLGRFSGN